MPFKHKVPTFVMIYDVEYRDWCDCLTMPVRLRVWERKDNAVEIEIQERYS